MVVRFFDSYFGMYMLQTVVHSLVTLLIVEMTLSLWEVENADERFRYRLLVLVLPFIMFPVFQFLNPERGSFYFVQDTALFSSLQWFGIEVYGWRPFMLLFCGITAVTSGVFVLQELVPIARDYLGGGTPPSGRPADAEVSAIVADLCRRAGIPAPALRIIEGDHPVIFTAGTKSHTIVMTEALCRMLDMRQIKSAMAHELAHIARRTNATTLIVFVVRICMFFNPFSLVEFRRLIQDDEHICDDMTVAVTDDPGALASALRLFWIDLPQHGVIRVAEIREVLEGSSHNLQLHERILRLENGTVGRVTDLGWGLYSVTIGVAVAINYFIV